MTKPHKLLILNRAGSRARTDDLLITNQLLYQLSYAGIPTDDPRLAVNAPLLNRNFLFAFVQRGALK